MPGKRNFKIVNKVLIEDLDDREILSLLLKNDEDAVHFFFKKKCSKLIAYIADSIFDGNIDYDELTNELYLYFQENDWHRLKIFAYRSSLLTYVTTVATRYFIKERDKLIENQSSESLISEKSLVFEGVSHDVKMDVRKAIDEMPNERYRMVIRELYFLGTEPEQLSQKMNISIKNLYNIHRRAKAQLKLHLGTKEEYYD